ncbi:cyclin-T1-like [Juglans regia]|uniref:Cyclin-T1-like n=1 Tax=Juglans regia TaxID=51240 RepID=A0A2I4GUH5_JUGRE|nr:cyclin-T1-like [Juglans regia]
MPTKTGTYSKEKSVLLKVYVEHPRKKRVSQSQHHHHHHHHHHLHQTIRREVILYNVNGASTKGYDRRAQLLQYSRQLRLSARSASKSPFESSSSSGNHKPTSQSTVAVPRKSSKSKHPKTPGCSFGNWKILLPSFFRSLTGSKGKKERKNIKQSGWTSSKIKAFTKSLQMQKKKRGSISGCINSTVGKSSRS